MDIFYNNGIGDWFISDEQKDINDSMLKDAELQRQQQEAMLQYLQSKKVSAGSPQSIDQQTILIVGILGAIMVFTVIMMT